MSEIESSPINQPHVDDDDDSLDFFGDEANGDLKLDPSGATPPAEELTLPEAASVEELAAGSTVTVNDGPEVEGTVESRDNPDPDAPIVEPAGDGEASGKASGTAERPYVILQELTLDKDTLEAMLASVAQGQEPRGALFEIERLDARNHKHAFARTWENQEYGPSARLAAVTERAMVVKTIKPRVITTNALDIS